MATKLGKMVIYLDVLLPIKSHYPLITFFIFHTTVPMATKPGRMITYLDRLIPIKSHDLLITWSFEIT